MKVSPARVLGGMLIVLLTMTAAACSSSKTGSSLKAGNTGNTTNNSTSGQVPDPNATLTFASASGSSPLANPHTWAGGLNGWQIYTFLYDRLLQLTPSGDGFQPMLATSWTWNSTNTQLTLALRHDVMFQDGTPFNADVAVQNLMAGSGPNSNGAVSLALMTSVVAIDPYTVRLTFSQPDPDAAFALTFHPGMMVSLNGLAHPGDLAQHPMGSGPFELQSIGTALTFTFVRFDGYWNKSRVFPARIVETNILAEPTRLDAVETGQADLSSISSLTYGQAKADKNLQTAVYHQVAPFYIFMNNTVAPLNNPQVRQAVSLAIERQAYDVSQGGLCPGVSQAIPPGMVGNISSLGVANPDVVKAKQLIQSAGATGAKIQMLDITYEPYPTFARIAQSQLDAIGLNIEIVQLPAGATFISKYQGGGYGMLLTSPNISGPDTSQMLDNYVLGPGNPGTKDPALVSKIHQAEQYSVGTPQRAAAMQAINKDLISPDDMLWVAICQAPTIYVGSKKVMGLDNVPSATISAAGDFSHLQVAK
jgi:ABC-type transport system substrate-binding protein